MNKQEALDMLRRECAGICSEPLVFGEGDPDGGIMFIGEAPGEREAAEGRPFVGKAGRNLDGFLDVLGLEREQIYITNLVKIRPYKTDPVTGRRSNRPPNRSEIALFAPMLMREIACIEPKTVITLGNYALRAVKGDGKAEIGALHGSPAEVSVCGYKTVLFPMYHPASIIYRPTLKEVYENDLKRLRTYFDSL